ncbi:methyl-accepting chemotaxis protein [Falsiroseomonas sp. CW058]|uniref:methyl-accepting chemotaxis protein n=1 Tax=Falsiroseomonas sp. CW058 TaxID=3388664 RepID=UPI003D319BFD
MSATTTPPQPRSGFNPAANLGILAKILIALGALATAAVIVGVVALSTKQRIADDFEKVVEEMMPGTLALARMNRNTSEFAALTYRAILAAQDPAQLALVAQQRDAAVRTFNQRLTEARQRLPRKAAELTQVEAKFREVSGHAGAALDAARDPNGGQDRARSIMRERFIPPYEALRDELVRMTNLAVDEAEAESANARADVAAATWTISALLGAGLVLAGALSAWLLLFGTARPVGALGAATARIAAGELDEPVPGTQRRDEAGSLARSLEVLRETARRARALEAEATAARERAEAERRAAALASADGVEAAMGGVVRALAASATELQATAESLDGTARRTAEQAASVAAGATQASANVQTVAAAAEEMNSAIGEITRQVGQAANMARRAVEDSRRTDATVRGLSESAARIGDVVKLISDIAGQTNLLALNATIEAARAGDAGKGFAVVAGEVKQLAAQTAKATEEIGRQIGEIQGATEQAVEAIRTIGTRVEEVDQIAAAIAAAVEEQGAATQEIARSVGEAAQGTNDVSASVSRVTAGVEETTQALVGLRDATGDVARQGTALKAALDQALQTMRAA